MTQQLEAMKLAFEKMTGIVGAWEMPALMQSRNGFIQGWEAAAIEQAQKQSDIPKIGCVNHDCDKCQQAEQDKKELEATERQVEILTDELANAQLRIEQFEQAQKQGCDYCNHSLYAGTQCKNCGRVTEQAQGQEPVAWPIDGDVANRIADKLCVSYETVQLIARELTSPPQRQWVGLTDEECEKIWRNLPYEVYGKEIRMIEQVIKDKNT